MLFQTSFIEKEAGVFHYASFQIITMGDVGIGKDVYANVGSRLPVSLTVPSGSVARLCAIVVVHVGG